MSEKICSVEDCNEKVHAKGMCNRHYRQMLKHGKILEDKPKYENCSIEGCNEKHFAKGYCERHYRQVSKHGKITNTNPPIKYDSVCTVEGCNEKHCGKGYCEKHLSQIKKHGKILERTVHDPNEIVIYSDYAEIVLYNKDCEEIARALIDLDDIDKCKDIKWGLSTNGYVKNKKIGKLHRFIMNPPADMVVDHINHDKLDNRKSNLRICTIQENTWNSKKQITNTTGYKGVTRTHDNKYFASIKINKEWHYLGRYETAEEASKAYNKAAKELQGEFAYIENNGGVDDND